ncbi:MAG: phenylalanine--tRNA ligase subunit beta, partial [Gemmatimonadales bacterium]
MIVSRRWLEDLLGRPLAAADVAERMTRHCAPVEAVTPIHQDLGGVLVARVLEVRRHPNADRLSLCVVDAGGAGGPLEVVCGAANVTAGKTYPFAPVGTVLPGGLTLERRTIRGVESNGMLCSARELGLGDDQAGILELDTPAPPGTRLLDAVPLADDRIDIEVFANRPDLLGHKGVARELAAVLGGTVKLPVFPGAPSLTARPPIRQSARGVVDGLEVRLEDPEGAPRYLMAVIRGARIGPSPAWLARRLASVGQRPINNVVDATNYILLELSQPLHAFDLARLRGPAVVVRRARPGERIVTLDGVERTLTPEMTVIGDAEQPTIVAGVMGSAESGVIETTRDVVLECACFEGTRIRRTRRALGLASESSYRFERGIDVLAMPDALRRAVELIIAVAGGELREPPLDLWPEPRQPRTVFLRPERVSHLLGTDIPRAETERLLAAVGFVAAPKGERLAVQVPGWRPDVTREVDLIEEVARLRGYDTFPDDLRAYRPSTVPSAPSEGLKAQVRALLAGEGLYEARTSPLGPPDAPEAIAVRNPLSAEDAHLRSRLLAGLVRRVQHNWAQRNREVRLFEVGTVVAAGKGEGGRGTGAPQEDIAVAGVLTGARRPPHWTDGSKVPDMDIWDLKHHFELAVGLAFPGARIEVAADGPGWDAEAPGGARVGWAGPVEADAPVWAGPLFGFEVRLSPERRERARYGPLPEMPAVERDVALVLPAAVSAAAVEACLRRAAGPLLERVEAFDEFRGGTLPPGTRSVAWHCVFRDPQGARTLREGEVDGVLAIALRALEDELAVRRR